MKRALILAVVLGVAMTLYGPLMSMLGQIETRPRF